MASSSSSSSSSRVALITGSTSGIGLAMARKFAQGQHDIILHGFGSDQLIGDIKEEIKKLNGKDSHHFNADLSKMDEVNKLADDILKLYPDGIDVLCNNAGIMITGDSQDEKLVADFDFGMDLMAKAPLLLCRRFIPYMKKKDSYGRIVNTSSQLGLKGRTPHNLVYCMIKHAVVGLTRSIALEVAQHNVTCNAICPGPVNTPLGKIFIKDTGEYRGLTPDERRQEIINALPIKKQLTPEAIAGLAWYLCSEEASEITGSALSVDGGLSAM